MKRFRWLLLLFVLGADARADEARDALIVETVLRLDRFDYAAAPDKIKGAIGRYLDAGRGGDAYFDLVERFAIAEQIPVLAELASREGADPRAARLLVELGGAEGIRGALAGAGEGRPKLVAALGSVNAVEVVGVLEAMLADEASARAAARAMAGSPIGQARLLELAAGGDLPEALRGGVGLALAASADPAVRARAAELLPPPEGLGGVGLPPISELVTRRGDEGKGELIYMRACFTCHQVGDRGIDFGPALTQIGAKLARQALYTAILDPDEAISFGYEGVTVVTKAGATYVGFVSGDSEDPVALKVPGGALVEIAADEIASKTPLGASLMPAGLVATMTQEDLVDLVEYLSALK